VQQAFVAEFFSSTFTLGRKMIDFNDIGVLKEQLTPTTLSLLLPQERALNPIKHGMGFESLAPIEEIAIVVSGIGIQYGGRGSSPLTGEKVREA